ncbi:hypothetical protein T484DRAFT_1979253 [Baffinella frigidus]|nr:hypothetical protein T484DRAFT_1979253 [Cryptophyta sp. CCMP2293]
MAAPSPQDRVRCDVLPQMEASVHDTWSSLNFSEHVAGMLRQFCTENKNYFSRGTTYPRRQDLGVAVAAPDSVGIGVILERNSDNGGHYVKGVSPNGAAHRAGLEPGDLVLQVDGVAIRGFGHELTDMIVGPPNTMVVIGVERRGEFVGPFRVLREAPSVDPRSRYSRMSQPYEEVPHYISPEDRDNAQREAALRVKAIREKVYQEAGLQLTEHPPYRTGGWGGASTGGGGASAEDVRTSPSPEAPAPEDDEDEGPMVPGTLI